MTELYVVIFYKCFSYNLRAKCARVVRALYDLDRRRLIVGERDGIVYLFSC